MIGAYVVSCSKSVSQLGQKWNITIKSMWQYSFWKRPKDTRMPSASTATRLLTNLWSASSWSDSLLPRHCPAQQNNISLIARFMGPTWGPSGDDRTQVGPMLAPWTELSGIYYVVQWRSCQNLENVRETVPVCVYHPCTMILLFLCGHAWDIVGGRKRSSQTALLRSARTLKLPNIIEWRSLKYIWGSSTAVYLPTWHSSDPRDPPRRTKRWYPGQHMSVSNATHWPLGDLHAILDKWCSS